MEVDCHPCPPGQFCSLPGLVEPSGSCGVGFLCQGGAKSAQEKPCPAHRFCPKGTISALYCAAGFYMPEGAKTCAPCPAGSYCSPTSNAVPQLCKGGFFCPQGTTHAQQHPCPPGTFNERVGQKERVSGCRNCTAGSFCARPGLDKVSGPCHNGFMCPEGSVSPEQMRCLKGSYCTAGNQVQCEKGTYDSYGGLRNKNECQKCPRGRLCDTLGAKQPGKKCPAGSFCDWGSRVPKDCPEGHFCEAGTEAPQPCPEGTFRATPGAESDTNCTKCSEGTFCIGSGRKTDGDSCPAGYFCPKGTKANVRLCPVGMVCAPKSGAPQTCAKGFTSREGASKCENCLSGFECFPSNPGQPGIRPCPAGKYCEANSDPKNCTAGTIRRRPGARRSEDCEPCPGGRFCTGKDLTSPTGICDEGFFCLQGATEAKPDGKTIGSGLCPKGHYCEKKTKVPQPCSAGTYQPKTGQKSCL